MSEKNCSSCKYQYHKADEIPCNMCFRSYIDKYKPITNYDRIKSMSVEEMAEMLIEVTEAPLSGEPFWRTPDGKLFSIWEKTKDKAIEHTKKWLLQEVSENE